MIEYVYGKIACSIACLPQCCGADVQKQETAGKKISSQIWQKEEEQNKEEDNDDFSAK